MGLFDVFRPNEQQIKEVEALKVPEPPKPPVQQEEKVLEYVISNEILAQGIEESHTLLQNQFFTIEANNQERFRQLDAKINRVLAAVLDVDKDTKKKK